MLIPASLAFIFSHEGHISLKCLEYPVLDEQGNMQWLFGLAGILPAKIWDFCNACGPGNCIYIFVCAEEITSLLGKPGNSVYFQISLCNTMAKWSLPPTRHASCTSVEAIKQCLCLFCLLLWQCVLQKDMKEMGRWRWFQAFSLWLRVLWHLSGNILNLPAKFWS